MIFSSFRGKDSPSKTLSHGQVWEHPINPSPLELEVVNQRLVFCNGLIQGVYRVYCVCGKNSFRGPTRK